MDLEGSLATVFRWSGQLKRCSLACPTRAGFNEVVIQPGSFMEVDNRDVERKNDSGGPLRQRGREDRESADSHAGRRRSAGQGEVALTCGTDLKVYQRGYHARMIVPPALFGHELAGVIEEVGPGVKEFKRGMRVVALNSAPCGKCFYCSKHQENLCEDLLFNNGAYAEYIRIPRRIVEANMLAIPR